MRQLIEMLIYASAIGVSLLYYWQDEHQKAIYWLLVALINKPKEATDAGE